MDVIYRLPILWYDDIELRRVMNAPLKSKSLHDFWANRWDLAIQRLLVRSVYKPLLSHICARNAMVLTFAASGAVHAYGLVLLGERKVLSLASMFLFFLLQPLCAM